MNPTDKNNLDSHEVKQDIDIMIWSMRLQNIRRFFHLRFWEDETRDSEYAIKVEPNPRLESVADHSWHLTDIILLLGRHYTFLDINKCIKLAILHDKLEILTGDLKPIGRDGTGQKTYAFDETQQFNKKMIEREAMQKYLSMIAPSAYPEQSALLNEVIECTTAEALFVKAIDKIQTLFYIFIKKKGNIADKHFKFSLDYAEKALEYFPEIEPYYSEIRSRLILQVAKKRSKTIEDIEKIFKSYQLQLFE